MSWFAGFGRHKINAVPRMNDLGKLALSPIDSQGSRGSGCPVKHLPLSIDRYRYTLPGTSHNIPKTIAVHHQKIQSRKASASEKLCRLTV